MISNPSEKPVSAEERAAKLLVDLIHFGGEMIDAKNLIIEAIQAAEKAARKEAVLIVRGALERLVFRHDTDCCKCTQDEKRDGHCYARELGKEALSRATQDEGEKSGS